jgi:hypothetical protein
LWWIKDKLKREQISSLPPALALRLDVQKTLAALPAITNEREVRQTLLALNERIRKMSFAACYGPSVDVVPLDIEEAIVNWRQRDSRARSD